MTEPPPGGDSDDISAMIDPRPARMRQPPVGGEGDVTVYAADEQAEEPVDLAKWTDVATNVLLACGARGNAELSLLFVDETTIASLNHQFMGHDGPTDVLSFPIDGSDLDDPHFSESPTGPDRPPADPDDMPLLLGDVIICPRVARRNAESGDPAWHAGTYDDEVALLVVHGILHVLGMDHANPAEEAAMKARTETLLDQHYRAHYGRSSP
jgi:probable rRNA maturation factor